MIKYTEDNSQGIEDESRIISYLRTTQQYSTIEAVPPDDIRQVRDDIDVVVDGHPVSIKAQHTGLKFGHIYVELIRHTQYKQKWDADDCIMMQEWFDEYGCTNTDTNKYLSASWWFTGKATHYLILQGNRLRLYRKSDIAAHIQHHGFLHIKALSHSVLRQQQGINTWCGYLSMHHVPYIKQWDNFPHDWHCT